MTANKTQPTGRSVEDFIAAVEHPTRRADALVLDAMFRRVTGWQPRMWGPTLIGYGEYHYAYDSGRTGDFLATGFSPRKANLVLYIMPGYTKFDEFMDRLGKYKLGKSCLYINKLTDVNLDVVEELVQAGIDDLSNRWPVKGT